MSDYLVRALAANGTIRVLAARSTRLVNEAASRHDTWPTATAALGRTLTASAIIARMLKDEQRVTLRILGDGPIGGLIAESRPDGSVRGYARFPHVHLPLNAAGKLDVGGAVGKNGVVHVTHDLGLRQTYSGSSELVSGEIGEDLARYFVVSQQIPSMVALGVLVAPDGSVRASGGVIAQLLPGADEEAAARLEAAAARLGAVSHRIDAGATPEELIEAVLEGQEYRTGPPELLRYACTCSRRRLLEEVLPSLGRHAVQEMLEEDGGAEMHCRFCGEAYRFDAGDLKDVLARMEEPAGADDSEPTP